MTFRFQLVTPERTVIDAEVESVTCSTTEGQITILPHHASLLAELGSGEVVVRGGAAGEQSIGIAGGFLQVKHNSAVTVLADAAHHAHELDEQEIQLAVQRAKERLAQENLSSEEYAVVAAMLERNLSHLQFVRKHAHRHKTPITSEGVRED